LEVKIPLPEPQLGEEENQFISRFIRDKEAKRKFPNRKQRIAVAYSIWRGK
jgi:hypothetical protein